MKNILRNVAGSLKIKIPVNTVPTAPIPVNMAYAVPIGKLCVAFTNKLIPTIRHNTNPMYQYVETGVTDILAFPRQNVNNTSKIPDNIK
jgi:hypothetical protein